MYAQLSFFLLVTRMGTPYLGLGRGGGGGGCIFPVGSSLYEVGRRDGERRGGPGAPLIACRAPHVPQGTAAVATAAAADNANK